MPCQYVGLLYEAKLCQSLKAAGLAFWTEDDLRSQGFFKTPDAKLQVGLMLLLSHYDKC